MNMSSVFGWCCLTWAVLLTIGLVMEKGKLFVKGKERAGYGMMAVLYVLGIILVVL